MADVDSGNVGDLNNDIDDDILNKQEQQENQQEEDENAQQDKEKQEQDKNINNQTQQQILKQNQEEQDKILKAKEEYDKRKKKQKEVEASISNANEDFFNDLNEEKFKAPERPKPDFKAAKKCWDIAKNCETTSYALKPLPWFFLPLAVGCMLAGLPIIAGIFALLAAFTMVGSFIAAECKDDFEKQARDNEKAAVSDNAKPLEEYYEYCYEHNLKPESPSPDKTKSATASSAISAAQQSAIQASMQAAQPAPTQQSSPQQTQ